MLANANKYKQIQASASECKQIQANKSKDQQMQAKISDSTLPPTRDCAGGTSCRRLWHVLSLLRHSLPLPQSPMVVRWAL